MTLNNTISRLSTIALAHKQVQSFKRGLVSDFLTDKTTVYPAVFVQDHDGGISFSGGALTMNFKLFFVDLVHVSEDAKDNEQEVHSDMISVAMDILSQLNHPNYSDWRVGTDSNLQLLVEDNGDMYAGVSVDISIRTMYKQNVCAVPTTMASYTATTGTRARITLNKDLVTGELTLLITQLPSDAENNTPTDQDITVTDFLKGFVLTTASGAQGRMTLYKNAAGELELILTEL